MKVSSLNTNFKGIKIAQASVRTNKESLDFDVYKITPKDKPFLEDLYKKTDLCALYPNLSHNHYLLWKDVLKHSLNANRDEQIILLTKDNRPCGVLKYTRKNASIYVNNASSIPIPKQGKIPWVGATLFATVFKMFLTTPCQNIKLVALKETPFSNMAKYMRLGFVPMGGDYYNEKMVIDAQQVEKSLAKIKNYIEFSSIDNQPDVDLYSKLKI